VPNAGRVKTALPFWARPSWMRGGWARPDWVRPLWPGSWTETARRLSRRAVVALGSHPGAASAGFARLTVLPAILVIAWLLPGLPLLLAGAFVPVPMLLISAPLAVVLVVLTLRRVPASWPRALPGLRRERARDMWYGLAGTFVVAVGFTIWQLMFSSESVIVLRDSGALLQTGYWIAQHGSLPIPQSLAAFGGAHPGLSFSSPGFFASGNSVVPGSTAGLPMLLAGGFWVHGISVARAMGPILGGMAVLAFGGLTGRLAGPRWAAAGALVLGFTLPEQYTSRTALAETAMQILLFGGLCLVIDAVTVGRRAQAAAAASAAAEPGVAGAAGAAGAAEPRVAAELEVAAEPGVAGAAGAAELEVAAEPGVAGAAGAAELEVAAEPGVAGAAGAAGTAEPRAAAEPGVAGAVRTAGAAEPGVAGAAGAAGAARPAGAVEAAAGEPSATAVTSVLRGWPGRRNWDRWYTPRRAMITLGGLSLGLTAVVQVGGLLDVVPAIAFIGILVAGRRSVGIAFSIGLVIGAAYGLAAGYLLARPFMASLKPAPEAIGLIAVWLGALTLAALELLRYPRLRDGLQKALARRPLCWLPEACAILAAVAVIGLALRPYLHTVRAAATSAEADYVAVLQQAQHLRLDPGRTYAEDTLYWVIWYVGLPAILLGTFGLALIVRRCVRALVTWRDPSGAARTWALPLAIISVGSAAVLWDPAITPDQPSASRRLVPLVLPGLIICAMWGAAWLVGWARVRGAGPVAASVVAVCCVAALLVPTAVTTFGLGLTHSGKGGGLRPIANGLALKQTGQGEISGVRGLCASIRPGSSVIILDRLVAQRFLQVIRGMCGVPAASMAGQPAAAVATVVSGVGRAGRQPVLLGARPRQLAGYGGSPAKVLDLPTTQEPHTLTQPPTMRWPVRYVIWLTVPNGFGVGT
jgi:hypothetical protein